MSDTIKPSPAEQLAALQTLFRKQLPERFLAIEQAWEAVTQKPTESDIKELHRCVHGLAGSGGTFGADDISQVAQDAEILLKSAMTTGGQIDAVLQQQISDKLAHLKQVIDTWLVADSELPAQLHAIAEPQEDLIYLVDANPVTSTELAENLKQVGYEAKLFSCWKKFLATCGQSKVSPAAILMDIDFTEEINADAAEFSRIREELNCHAPVVFISACQDIESRLAAARAGAVRYFTKPLDLKKLAQTLDGLTLRVPKQPYRILYIEDEQEQLDYYTSVMEESGMVVEALSDPLKGLGAMSSFQPDLVLLDVYMPECSGLELAQVIRQEDSYAQIPIVFLSVESNLDRQLAAMNLGGDDFLTKPLDPARLVMSVRIRAKRARWMSRINKELKAALRESEYRRVALDQHAIVSLMDTEGNMTFVNDKFCSSTGYARKELIGQNIRMIESAHHPADFYKELWHVISQGDIWRNEICKKRKNGELLWLDTTIVPFVEEDGKPSKYGALSTDITDLKLAQQALMQAKTEAEDANRAKSQFLARMSHELRTPMNAILGFSQLLQMDKSPALSSEQLDGVKEIHRAGHHLLELINEVLDLSKIEAGRIDLSIEHVDIGLVLIECISLIAPLAEKRGVKISCILNGEEMPLDSVAEMELKVMADITGIKQVLLNLLSNGVKYNSEQGSLKITFDAACENALRIAVTDTGNGLTVEQQGQLFTAFNRLGAEYTEVEGTGIGLVITKKIVELMGGSIGVESEVGKGSAFWIELKSECSN
ncbi:response regulator [Pseudomonadota bacterium]